MRLNLGSKYFIATVVVLAVVSACVIGAFVALTVLRSRDIEVPSPFDPSKHPNFAKFSCGKCRNGTVAFENRLLGGQKVALDVYPFIARLSASNKTHDLLFCGGSLISEDYVLTAAHCFDGLDSSRNVSVHLVGTKQNDFYDTLVIRNISIIKHEKYDRRKQLNDIALIKLLEPLDRSFNESINICLPFFDPVVPDNITLIGYTNESRTDNPTIAHGEVPSFNNEECFEMYDKWVRAMGRNSTKPITDAQFCAGSEEIDTTKSDSGMPALEIRNISATAILHGIVLYGVPDHTLPGVFTKTHSYLEWIMDNAV